VGGKRGGLEAHDVLFLNRDLLKRAPLDWTEQAIRERTDELAGLIVEIWRAPAGHRSGFAREKSVPRRRLDLSDLMAANWIAAGQPLFARRRKYADLVATVLPDGRLDIAGSVFAAPSAAATSVTGRPTNGWHFFLVDKAVRRSLRDVRRDYFESCSEDVEDDDADDDGDDDS
jgi:hypothetical protein